MQSQNLFLSSNTNTLFSQFVILLCLLRHVLLWEFVSVTDSRAAESVTGYCWDFKMEVLDAIFYKKPTNLWDASCFRKNYIFSSWPYWHCYDCYQKVSFALLKYWIWIVLKSVLILQRENANVTVTKEPKRQMIARFWKKWVLTWSYGWEIVGKGGYFADRFVINNWKDNFGEKNSPDFARYHNVWP